MTYITWWNIIHTHVGQQPDDAVVIAFLFLIIQMASPLGLNDYGK